MYNSTILADRIKTRAKEQRIQLKAVWAKVGITDNTLTNLRKGSMLGADKLALIADYLSCSVDYLLGRTDDPNGHGTVSIGGDNNNNGTQAINGSVSVTAHEKQPDSLTEQFLQQFDSLSFEDKLAIMQHVQDIKKSSPEGDGEE